MCLADNMDHLEKFLTLSKDQGRKTNLIGRVMATSVAAIIPALVVRTPATISSLEDVATIILDITLAGK